MNKALLSVRLGSWSHCACPPRVDLDLDLRKHGDQLFSEGRGGEDVEDEVTTIV